MPAGTGEGMASASGDGAVALSWCHLQHLTPRWDVSGGCGAGQGPLRGPGTSVCSCPADGGGHVPAASLCRGSARVSDQADGEAPWDLTPRFLIVSALSCV